MKMFCSSNFILGQWVIMLMAMLEQFLGNVLAMPTSIGNND